MSVGAILLCAGRGERLGGDLPKAFVPLAGRPLFTWSLEALERTEAVEAIVVVGAVRTLRELLAASGVAAAKVVAFVDGGRERQHSVARGLAALPPACDTVLVHDSARALVTPALITRVAADAIQYGAAIAAAPVEDTLKRGTLEFVENTVPRAGLWRAQTPQGFRRAWLERAHAEAGVVATDDAALVEALGHRVRLTRASTLNLKITTPEDLRLAEAWLSARPTEG